jgi:hypothetical protein
VATYRERKKRHKCPQSENAEIFGHDAELSISKAGIVDIDFVDADGMVGSIEFQALFCPFCGFPFETGGAQ